MPGFYAGGIVSTWTKLPPLDSKANPCGCCPRIPTQASLEKIIAVGFGTANVTRDNEMVLDGERMSHDGETWATFADAEALALADPDHDWRVTLDGPLHGETYQRQGDGVWLLVETNEGFA
jgi:hypothetical protein